jgi:hypothetical protein
MMIDGDRHRSKQAKINLKPNLVPRNNPSTKKLKLKLKATNNKEKKE